VSDTEIVTDDDKAVIIAAAIIEDRWAAPLERRTLPEWIAFIRALLKGEVDFEQLSDGAPTGAAGEAAHGDAVVADGAGDGGVERSAPATE
jgi:hypothetical protein